MQSNLLCALTVCCCFFFGAVPIGIGIGSLVIAIAADDAANCDQRLRLWAYLHGSAGILSGVINLAVTTHRSYQLSQGVEDPPQPLVLKVAGTVAGLYGFAVFVTGVAPPSPNVRCAPYR